MTTGTLAADRRREIEEFLDGWLVRESVPGTSVAVVNRDGIVHAAGLGARDLAARDPATPDTLYSFASATKTVTGLAILKLVDRGALDLADPIRDHADYWTDVPGDPITVEDLLTHSSGMPDDGAHRREYLFADDPPASPLVTPEDRVRHANAAADRRILDEEWFMYSDLGYAILGLVVESVDGRDFAAFVDEEVFEPLGMERSRIGYGDHAAVADDAAQGYAIEDGRPVSTDFDLDAVGVGDPQAAGGLMTSVREMARLVRCTMNGGTLDGTRIVDEDLVEAATGHRAPKRWSIDGDARGYGYGWLIDDAPAERVVGHGGTAPGVAHAFVGFLPESGLGVALAFNATGFPKQQIGKGVLAIAAGEDPAGFVPPLALREKVANVRGTYEGFRGAETARVGAEGSTVTVTFGDGERPDLRAIPASSDRDDYSFHAVGDHMRVAIDFRETDAGMELRVGGRRLVRTNG